MIMTKQKGVTLVELMIGLALGLLVLLAMTYIYAGSRGSHRQQESYSMVQESGRIALELMGRDLRMAGFPGCGNAGYLEHLSASTVTPVPPLPFDGTIAIGGVDNPAGTPDEVTVRGGGGETVLTANAMPTLNQIDLESATALGVLAANDYLLLSDCVYTEVVRVDSVAGATVTLDPPATNLFRRGSVVTRFQLVTYTVSDGELRRNGVAIAEGVTDMQIRYGVADASRSLTHYVTNPNPAAVAEDVVAVKINLTIQDGAGGNAVTRPFSSTFTLRNRAP